MAAVALAREPFDPGLLAALRERLGERVTTAAAVCAQHGIRAVAGLKHTGTAFVTLLLLRASSRHELI